VNVSVKTNDIYPYDGAKTRRKNKTNHLAYPGVLEEVPQKQFTNLSMEPKHIH
jgi:hypothetical protein